MASRALRRLVSDHASLHHNELPPNYLFPPASTLHSDDLTQLDILLAGPTHTPFSAGLWKLHLSIPHNYPQEPPIANFRTPIFHPNVDPSTGGVCVETLKRDWKSDLTLRDVLVTISCLLIQPNPDSALNVEAGALIQEDYARFAARAELLTSIHAVPPHALHASMKEAQNRGQEPAIECNEDADNVDPTRRRRTIAKVRASKMSGPSSNETSFEQRHRAPHSRPFVFQAGNDDVFGISPQRQPEGTMTETYWDDVDPEEKDQENHVYHAKGSAAVLTSTPRRPNGLAMPLGELIMESENSSSDAESGRPQSSRNAPSTSPPKRRLARDYDSLQNVEAAESSRSAALRARNITPANYDTALDFEGTSFMTDVTFECSQSPRKIRRGLFDSPQKSRLSHSDLFGSIKAASPDVDQDSGDVLHEDQLWALCGGDIRRWNRGDFDGQPFHRKAARW